MKEIKRLLSLDWQVQVSHVYKEGNMCADALANLAYQMQESDSVVFELAPSSICSLVSSTAS